MKRKRILLATLLLGVTLGITNVPTTVMASDATNTEAMSSLETEFSKYIKIEDHKFVLKLPENSVFSKSEIAEIQQVIDKVNDELEKNDVEVDRSVPIVSFARAKKGKKPSRPKPVAYGANGYFYRDKKGGWHYVVTKSPGQAVFEVFRGGLESSLGGGWISGGKKSGEFQNFINGKR